MSTVISRRSFFKYMLTIGTVSFFASPLQAKITKLSVKYQKKTTHGKKCNECAHFIAASNECKLVKGKIDAEGWCTYFLQKS